MLSREVNPLGVVASNVWIFVFLFFCIRIDHYLGRRYIEANEALASVNYLKCCLFVTLNQIIFY